MEAEGASRQAFPDTRWSLVLRTRGSTEDSRQALEVICGNYWRPLYAFARRSGKSPEEAEDLTQDFLIHLLEKKAFQSVEDNAGKLRSFLLGAFQNFKTDQYRKAQALKRGGGTQRIPLDTQALESDLGLSEKSATPAEEFERQWAFDLLDEAMAKLRADYEKSGKGAVFEGLHPVLHGGTALSYGKLAERLGMREGAVKVAVHRMRQRFRACLEQGIMETVGSEDEAREELDFIKTALARG